MPRLNVRLGNRENVKVSLTKIDLKHKCAKLPTSWLSRGKPSSLRVGWGSRGGEVEVNEREKRVESK